MVYSGFYIAFLLLAASFAANAFPGKREGKKFGHFYVMLLIVMHHILVCFSILLKDNKLNQKTRNELGERQKG